MKRLMFCLLAVVAMSACEPQTPAQRAAAKVGDRLDSAFVVDAATGKCLRLADADGVDIHVVDPAWCSR